MFIKSTYDDVKFVLGYRARSRDILETVASQGTWQRNFLHCEVGISILPQISIDTTSEAIHSWKSDKMLSLLSRGR